MEEREGKLKAEALRQEAKEAELRDPGRIEVEAVCRSSGWSLASVSTKKGRRGGRR